MRILPKSRILKTWTVAIFISLNLAFTADTGHLYLPTSPSNHVIEHSFYTLSYNDSLNVTEWVSYQISAETAFGSVARSNSFTEDPQLPETILKPSYANSGYDRGHLCPAGSMAFDPVAMKESFFMTNMSPQVPGFNRGIWKKLESQVRSWGYENQHVFVVTGPILNQFIDTIGNIPVPAAFYKVVIDITPPSLKGIGFILENQSSKLALPSFAVSIDSVEQLTGIDFYPALDDSLENVLEGQLDTLLWTWKPVKIKYQKESFKKAFYCTAKTKSGNPCSRMVVDSNSTCWQHTPEVTPEVKTMVWVCGKSKIYHFQANHRGLKNCKSEVKSIPLSKAIELGMRQCKE